MIVLDANVLIALFDADDALHARAETLLRSHDDEQLSISALTLAEFLIHPTAAGIAARAQLFVANMGIIVAPLLGDDATYLAGLRGATGLKMPDAIVLWLAQSSAAKLMTLDDHLARAAMGLGIDVVVS